MKQMYSFSFVLKMKRSYLGQRSEVIQAVLILDQSVISKRSGRSSVGSVGTETYLTEELLQDIFFPLLLKDASVSVPVDKLSKVFLDSLSQTRRNVSGRPNLEGFTNSSVRVSSCPFLGHLFCLSLK